MVRFVHFDLEMCFAPQRCAHFRQLNLKSGPKPPIFNTFDLEMCLAPQRRAPFRHLNFQKWSVRVVLCTFWLGHVPRHNGVHFFNLSTSKSALIVVRFVHFDLEMCFAPQRCALFRQLNLKSGPKPPIFNTFDLEMCFAPQWRAPFRHLNFQKWSVRVVLCKFWLGNVLRATRAYNGVHFFNLSTSKSALNVVRFVHFDLEMCFAPQRRALFRQLNLKKWFKTASF